MYSVHFGVRLEMAAEEKDPFERFLIQGQKLKLTEDKLAKYVHDCMEREERAAQRERDRLEKEAERERRIG